MAHLSITQTACWLFALCTIRLTGKLYKQLVSVQTAQLDALFRCKWFIYIHNTIQSCIGERFEEQNLALRRLEMKFIQLDCITVMKHPSRKAYQYCTKLT
jgi:hypothetical protein